MNSRGALKPRSGACFRTMVGALILAAWVDSPALAVTMGVGISHGQDTDDVSVGARWDWPGLVDDWSKGVHALGRVEFDITNFQGERNAPRHDNVRALAVIPEVRLSPERGSNVPFVDLGLGIGGVSEVTINGDRHFASAFQFTELLRVGLRAGLGGRWEVALSAQHFSNAGLKKPNDGITYGGVSLAWRF